MKKLFATILVLSAAMAIQSGKAHAYTNSRLMDDQIFDNTGSMNSSQIQGFFDGTYGQLSGGSPCLRSFNTPNVHWDGNDWYFGDNIRRGNSTGWAEASYPWNSAWGPAQIPSSSYISKIASFWGFNPQVIIATLQKEQSLVSGTACDSWRYTSAMGYDCDDQNRRFDYPAIGVYQTCVAHQKYAGFTRQVLWAGWQLKFNKERSYGNTSWDGDDRIVYGGKMTQGYRKRCGTETCSLVYYDGNASIDGQIVYMENGTTASFYTYTPHLGQRLPGIFEGWFGSATADVRKWSVDSWSSEQDLTSLAAGTNSKITLKAKNIGSTTWFNHTNTPIRLATSQPYNHDSPFVSQGWINATRPADMQESAVSPGGIATFVFNVRAPVTNGTYTDHFSLVQDNYTWLNDPDFTITLTSTGSLWAWNIENQSADKDLSQMKMGEIARVTLRAKNTGNTTWNNSGGTPVKLATTSPQNHSSPYFTSGWLSDSRPALLTESQVAPGNIGTFSFDIKAPSTGADFSEHFSLVAENYIWLNDPGFTLNVKVVNYWGWSIESTSSSRELTSLPSGFTAGITLRARNTSSGTWYNHGGSPTRLATVQSQNHNSIFATSSWISPSRPATLAEATVPPGGVGTFYFDVQAPAPGQTYVEHFSLVAENTAWFNDPGLEVAITPTQAWAWQIQSYSSSKDLSKLPSGSASTITLVARNSGATTWHNSGGAPVRLGTVSPQNHSSVMASSGWISGNRPAQLKDQFVPPGGYGTFIFDVKAPETKSTFTDFFSLVAENYTWLNDPGFNISLTSISPYSWEVVSQTSDRNLSTMNPNQIALVTLRVKNIGSIPWNNDGSTVTRLGTSNPYNSSSPFATNAWYSPSRPATLQESSVEPGQIGTFIFEIKAPSTAGSFSDKFNIVKESFAWLEDIGYTLSVTVVSP